MMKRQRATGVYIVLIAAVIAAVAAFLYGNVMYKYQPVYYFLIGAIVLSVVAFLLATSVPLCAGLIPVINAALLASAVVWAASLMVNQIGYVVAGLDGMDTIQGFIVFAVLGVIAMLLNIVAAFTATAKEEE